jgi:3-dehydroquinate dehydratase-2
MPKPIFALNRANLNLAGVREPAIHGAGTLDDMCRRRETRAQSLGLEAGFRPINPDGPLVDWIPRARARATKD